MENASLHKHLFSPGKKRILSLDGGGVRGALSIAYLERLETVLSEIYGNSIRLCDWFDLIGGTSTGAIIASGLTLGYSATDIHKFYSELSKKVFKQSSFHIPGWNANFNANALHHELVNVFGDCTLGSDKIITGLFMVLKRLDTGSCWLVTNNPKSSFWETPNDNTFVGNRYLLLADIVRASAAAPFYFDPQTIEINKGTTPGLFLDGGLTPHNNPSLALLLNVLLEPYGLTWDIGPSNLVMFSIGTGSHRPKVTTKEAQKSAAIMLAVNALAAQISDNQELTLTLMSWLGEGTLQWPVNSELGNLSQIAPPFGKILRYERFDVKLEADWLATNLEFDYSDSEIITLRLMDNPDNIPRLYEVGKQAAKRQITHNIVSKSL